MKPIRTLLIASIGLAVAWNALEVQAGLIAATIKVDWNYTQDIKTEGPTTNAGDDFSPLTTEFDLDVTAQELGLISYDTYGYCVDYYQHVYETTYAYELADLSAMGDSYFKIAWLIDTYAPKTSGSNSTKDTKDKKHQAAALQGLIWEILGGSAFKVTSTGKIGDYYSTYLAAYSKIALTSDMKNALTGRYMVAQNDKIQDLIVHIPNPSVYNMSMSSTTVPEPSALLLFGTGLVGLVGARLRKGNGLRLSGARKPPSGAA
ncbi:PEP-CTERM sorting domain-containing protein [Thiocystis violascens]|uniref:PEP-CTERM putative exosortase interaction domain-containing protein n=1 Tax=Thiocystis violascens (strain ATCC 17096 / DSM 198 / 6111) TaxID=765911 RepID=I3Y9N9_THIV6|nr:PEP-CTERM sorting domain-containing protein [Thiocystis violascens]AFL73707.1 PEP-CTERM putative exosortase interaction domain-containing protein [Thiocystis violascens DSM 198]